MNIRALESFSGALSMYKGQETECNNKSILKDLIKAKYIEEITEKSNTEKELQDEIEILKKQIEELKKVPETPPAEVNMDPEPPKDVKTDESKRNNSK